MAGPINPILDGETYFVQPNSYFKSEQPTASVPSFGVPVDLRPVKEWVQSSWRGGLGQRVWRDAEMYDDGAVDSYSDQRAIRCLPAPSYNEVTGGSTTFETKRVGMYFEVRALVTGGVPRLYFITEDLVAAEGEVWRILNTAATPTRTYPAAGVSTIDFKALYNSFRDDPHNLLLGTTLGKLYRISANSETVTGPLRNPVDSASEPVLDMNGYVSVMGAFNKAEYICISGGGQGGEVWRMPDKTWSKFAALDTAYVKSMTAWNGRLWIVGANSGGPSKLYVTDGNVMNEAYEWKDHFIAEALYVHYGALYVCGRMDSADESEHIGQVWKYNGATMDLLGSFDNTGLTDTPIFSSGVQGSVLAMGAFGRYLACSMWQRTLLDGNDRRGVWFYDPEQDAWHVGTYITGPFAAHTGNFAGSRPTVVSMRAFDGSLYFGMEDGAGRIFYLRNDHANYLKSFCRSSRFDGGVPLEDKLFSRVRVLMDIPAWGGTVITEASFDEGVTWTTLGTTVSTAARQQVVKEYTLGGGSGVIAKSVQLRLTLHPGNGSDATQVDTGTESPSVSATVVDYEVVPPKRYQWSFNVVAALDLEDAQGNVDERSAAEIISTLQTLSKNRTLVGLTDTDGTAYTVRVLEANEFRPDIPVGDAESEQAIVSVRLQQWF